MTHRLHPVPGLFFALALLFPLQAMAGPTAHKNQEFGFQLEIPEGWTVTDGQNRRHRELLATESAVDQKEMKRLMGAERELFSASMKTGGEVAGRLTIKAHNKRAGDYMAGYQRTLKVGLQDVSHKVLVRKRIKRINGRLFEWTRLKLTKGETAIFQEIWVTQSGKYSLMISATAPDKKGLAQLAKAVGTLKFSKK
jgi:hypothetical protein